ncbi:MAG: efflux RND transporter periplasmic adaptor subunit [Dehalococcoidia bacterium]|nr:efflux RND transporter periplasmic adaptor subunit [Dehalococcoidia bacterium]
MTVSIRTVVAALVAAGLLAAALILPGRMKSTPPPATPTNVAVPVEVATVQTGPIRASVSYAGTIQATETVNLAPKAAGQIASIVVGIGASVRAGDRIATLDPGTLAAQVLQAQAGVAAAEARLRVVQDGATTADTATATQAVFTADAAYTAAQSTLDGVLARSNAASLAASVQQQADRMVAQGPRAQADVDAVIARIPANNLYGAGMLRTNVSDLNNAIRTRCEAIANRDACETAGLNSPSTSDLVARLISTTTGAMDLAVYLKQYEDALAAANQPAVTEALFRLVQATAAQPSLSARVNNLALSLNSSAGSPSADAVRTAQRTSDAAASALEAARARLVTVTTGPTNADLLTSRATLSQAQAGLAVARAALDQTVVTAPFDGVVVAKLVDVGSSVSPVAPIFVLAAKAVELHLTVEEARISLMRPDLEAALTTPAFPGRTFRARVGVIAPSADLRAHSFDVTVYAEDADKQLRPGMSANVTIVTETRPSATLVLNTALSTSTATGASVLTIVDGKAKRRPITIGISDGTNTEVLDGLRAGEQVIAIGQNLARDGQAVQVVTPSPKR